MSQPFLSKSKYLTGMQCPKLLWYYYNAKDQFPSLDAATEAKFDQGEQVGQLAKKLFQDGIDVELEMSFDEVLKRSRELLKERKPLFEAGFMSNRTYARADVLNPVEGNQWDIIEVKMGKSVKKPNYHDMAFQRYCYQGAGISVNRCYLMHINGDYVRHGEIDPEGLFTKEDITDDLEDAASQISANIDRMLEIIESRQCPEQDIGPHCTDPYDCPLIDLCWAHVYKYDNHIFTLPYAYGRDWDLYMKGVLSRDKIPDDYDLLDSHRIVLEAGKTGQPHIDTDAIREFLSELKYPLYFLDFETFGYFLPLPLVDGFSPYKHVIFQYSLRTVEECGTEPTHYTWLWDGQGDPRPEMMRRLKEQLGTSGSILVYNQIFEKERLQETSEALPEYADWVAGIADRIVDLWAPFRAFHVYYPSQNCSTSMKDVLPALTGKTYDDIAISDGSQASEEFMRVTFADATQEDRNQVRKNLEEYCGLDTMGMVDIVNALRRLV